MKTIFKWLAIVGAMLGAIAAIWLAMQFNNPVLFIAAVAVVIPTCLTLYALSEHFRLMESINSQLETIIQKVKTPIVERVIVQSQSSSEKDSGTHNDAAVLITQDTSAEKELPKHFDEHTINTRPQGIAGNMKNVEAYRKKY